MRARSIRHSKQSVYFVPLLGTSSHGDSRGHRRETIIRATLSSRREYIIPIGRARLPETKARESRQCYWCYWCLVDVVDDDVEEEEEEKKDDVRLYGVRWCAMIMAKKKRLERDDTITLEYEC